MRFSEVGFAGRLLLEKVDDLCRLDKRGIYVQNLDSWKLVREFINAVQKYGIKPMACVAPSPGESDPGKSADEIVPATGTGHANEPCGVITIIRSELPPGLSFWQRLKFVFGG